MHLARPADAARRRPPRGGRARGDIVALSFSAAFPVRQATDSLARLRRHLPPPVALWAGGEMTRRVRKTLPGVVLLPDLAASVAALRSWRTPQRERAVALTRVRATIARMWTAVSLWVFNVAALGALRVDRGRARIAAGGSPAPWVIGVPLLYFGAMLRAMRELFRDRLDLACAPPAQRATRHARDAAAVVARIRDARRRAAAAHALPVARARSRAGAGRRCRCCCCTACCAMPACGCASRGILRERGVRGVYSLSYGPPLASIESFADQLAGKIDAIARGDRRAPRDDRRAQHGRPRRARLHPKARHRESSRAC